MAKRAILWALLLALAFPTAAPAAVPLPASEAAEESQEPLAPIELTSDDAEIRARLAQVFRAIDGLESVRIAVEGGVVTLAGTTLDDAARAEAEALAGRVAGVVAVENHIEVEHRLGRRLAPVVQHTEALGAEVLAYLPLIAVALVVFAAFWIAGVVFTRRTNIFRSVVENPFIETLLEQIVRALFILAGLVVAMSILGTSALIGSVLGAAGVLGLAIGFAMRDTIENYIASILLSVRQPFAPNDVVIIEGVEGRITTLNSRSTIITTWAGNEVRIPNAIVYKTKITNLTRTPERRFDFELRVRLDTDITAALAAALATVKAVDGVLEEPAPSVVVSRIDEYAIVITVLGWVDQRSSDFGKVKSETIRLVKEAFDARHIELAEPVQNYRELRAPRPEPAPTAAADQPTADELREITDTSRDRTIENKVAEQRAEADDDPLAPAQRA